MRHDVTLDDIVEHVDGMFPALEEEHSRDEILNDQALKDRLDEAITRATEVIESLYFDVEPELSIRVDGRLRRAMANIYKEDGDIKYNPKIFSTSFRRTISTICHELVHGDLVRGDDDPVFQETCSLMGVALNSDEIGVDEYWVAECPEHGVVAKRTRKTKIIKEIDRYHCPKCQRDLTSRKVNKK